MTTDRLCQHIKDEIEELSLGKHKSASISDEAKIISDLGLDSLDYATIMLGCELVTRRRVDEKTVNWRTVSTVRQLAELFTK